MNQLARPRPVPPAHVAPYVECLGYDRAADFLLTFGGGELSLSKAPRGDSAVSNLVGAEAVAAMAAHPRIGPRVRVPIANPWLAAVLAWQGHSTAEIARRLRATDVAVRRWLKRRRES